MLSMRALAILPFSSTATLRPRTLPPSKHCPELFLFYIIAFPPVYGLLPPTWCTEDSLRSQSTRNTFTERLLTITPLEPSTPSRSNSATRRMLMHANVPSMLSRLLLSMPIPPLPSSHTWLSSSHPSSLLLATRWSQ